MIKFFRKLDKTYFQKEKMESILDTLLEKL